MELAWAWLKLELKPGVDPGKHQFFPLSSTDKSTDRSASRVVGKKGDVKAQVEVEVEGKKSEEERLEARSEEEGGRRKEEGAWPGVISAGERARSSGGGQVPDLPGSISPGRYRLGSWGTFPSLLVLGSRRLVGMSCLGSCYLAISISGCAGSRQGV